MDPHISIGRLPMDITMEEEYLPWYVQRKNEKSQKSDVLQGILDLMALKFLVALGALHGYGIARRIEQVSEHVLQLNEGAVYISLLRL